MQFVREIFMPLKALWIKAYRRGEMMLCDFD